MRDTIKLTGIVDEDIVNYKKCSMFLSTATCTWKCCKDCGVPFSTCQNYELKNTSKKIRIDDILVRYLENNLSEALVIGGLEPFDQFDEVWSLLTTFRALSQDDIVIYTGYTKEEIITKGYDYHINSMPGRIIIKYGRYVPNKPSRYDEILGVTLASDNQFAEEYFRELSDPSNKFIRIKDKLTPPADLEVVKAFKIPEVDVELWAELTPNGEVKLSSMDYNYLDNIRMRQMSYIPWEDTEIYSSTALESIKESLKYRENSVNENNS